VSSTGADEGGADKGGAGKGGAGKGGASGDQGKDAPLIGLSTYQETAAWGVWKVPATVLPQAYVDHVKNAGGIPVLLPASGGKAAAAKVVAGLGGLVLTGGPDLDAALYDAEPHPDADRPHRDRDVWESALLAAALEADLPVLGICRGMQMLNISLGGTLHQHLPDAGVFGDSHRPEIGKYAANRIDLDPAAPPGRFLGSQIIAWCHHHQGIENLGDGLQSAANSTDGLIEAVWMPKRKFVVGVQWHPEEDSRPELFKALVDAARRFGGQR
jgi:putative glutamine amidotransferase